GYNYCHSCTDYQGLMPRPSPDTGYEAMNVCAYCIEYLNITAGGRAHLKGLQLSKLKNYINAYNIRAERAVEKDDLIDAILSAKVRSLAMPDSRAVHIPLLAAANGCLPPANEVRVSCTLHRMARECCVRYIIASILCPTDRTWLARGASFRATQPNRLVRLHCRHDHSKHTANSRARIWPPNLPILDTRHLQDLLPIPDTLRLQDLLLTRSLLRRDLIARAHIRLSRVRIIYLRDIRRIVRHKPGRGHLDRARI
ncbi:unnamed protein product, partial [Mycena citricolor]